MRISVDKKDPGFKKNSALHCVLFNGEKLDNCFTADEGMSKAWIFIVDSNDQIMLNDKRQPQTACLNGKVEIIQPSLNGNVDVF